MSKVSPGGRSPQSVDPYTIRPYRPTDYEAYLDLYQDVWGWRPCREWYEWRYESPSVDHVAMVVAEKDGALVGAEPFIPYRLRAGSSTVLAYQPADAMVHPKHRRNGLLTRMTEQALERYRSGEPTLFYNFPNDMIKSAYLRLGWSEVGHMTTYFRIQNPAPLLESIRTGTPTGFDWLLNGLTHSYLRVRDGLGHTDEECTVRRHENLPIGQLETLHADSVSSRLHAVRDPAYYRWRFSNPNWDCTTYVASRDEPVAALIVATVERNGVTHARIMDSAPLKDRFPDAFDALVHQVVADNPTVDVVTTADGTIPHEILRRWGFYPDGRPPLSLVASSRPLIVRPIADRTEHTVCDTLVTDRQSWQMTFSDQDGLT